MLIAVSSFGESLRRDFLTAPAEAVFKHRLYPDLRPAEPR
jgi:hypothetical protein